MSRKFKDEEKELHKNKILIEHSPYFNNDELVKYHLTTKNELLEYKCYSDKCPTKKGNWRRKPLYLILERKNSKLDDLRPENLRLICPNCYCQDKGPNYFNEFKKKIERKCRYCNYILNNKFTNDTCLVCAKKIREMDIELTSNEYAELISTTFDTTGNVSVAYRNEYSSIIDSSFDEQPLNSVMNSKLKYKSHSSSGTSKTSNKTKTDIVVPDVDINLNIELDDVLLEQLNNI